MSELRPDPAILLELVRARMPFGKYASLRIIHLPEPYLLWFEREGFPHGKLGEHMALALEIKRNGLERLLDPLLDDEGGP
ncbi:MAG: DUF3820 family protein [Myxococcales bacterium]|nr:DUF3820 family protein [Myxococcales bacterium]